MKQVGKKELKELASKLEKFNIVISKKDNYSRDDNFIILEKEIKFFEYEGLVLPTLKTIYSDKKIEESLKKVVVDMGAVKFAVKGADMMKPGITKYDSGITMGEPVLIVDESHGKPIALGISIFSENEYESQTTGKAVKNIHYVGDAIWHNNERT